MGLVFTIVLALTATLNSYTSYAYEDIIGNWNVKMTCDYSYAKSIPSSEVLEPEFKEGDIIVQQFLVNYKDGFLVVEAQGGVKGVFKGIYKGKIIGDNKIFLTAEGLKNSFITMELEIVNKGLLKGRRVTSWYDPLTKRLEVGIYKVEMRRIKEDIK